MRKLLWLLMDLAIIVALVHLTRSSKTVKVEPKQRGGVGLASVEPVTIKIPQRARNGLAPPPRPIPDERNFLAQSHTGSLKQEVPGCIFPDDRDEIDQKMLESAAKLMSTSGRAMERDFALLPKK